MMQSQDIERIARRRAGAKFGFFIHLTVFICVNAFLLLVNLATQPQVHWFRFPLTGWGIGLALHGLAVFLPSRGLREKMIGREIRKLEAQEARKP
jgi:hypothetical protein